MTHQGRRWIGVAVVALALLALVGSTPVLGFVIDGAGSPDAATNRYVIELADPPLAKYEGTLGKLAPTAAYLVGDVHLDVDSPAALAYLAHLDEAQRIAQARVRAVAPGARFDWRYRYVFNGFSATLTPDEAQRVMHVTGVRNVHVEEILDPEMDSSLRLVNAPAAFDFVGGIEEAGLNARVAIIDSGTDANHTFFNDEGMEAAPTGFPTATMHLRDGSVIPYPNHEMYVNNKIIGARIFVSPETMGSLDDPTTAITTFTPLGTGHGMHVSGIAAGRQGTYEVARNSVMIPHTLSGVAPMAHILNYKANYAASPEYIAMLDQMVVDEVDALNLSQGHVVWLIDRPETHPLARAFDGAADAGIVVAMSAGNAGSNGLTSLSAGFKYSDKVLAVGNSTTTGSYDVKLTLAGETRPMDEIISAPRGNFTHTAPIEGELIFVDDGCTETPEAAGKIAVAIRYQDGNWYGPCSYGGRAQIMADSGAKAIIYYYDNRYLGGPSNAVLALPSVAVGVHGGTELIEWLQTDPPDAAGTIDDEILRGYSDEPDLLSASSSRGPGLDWQIKPDITAPGTGILSAAYVNVGGAAVPSMGTSSGTSMSSPHIAGAATLLRSAHPDWTSAQVRSALVTTSKRSIKIGASEDDRRNASVYEGGPGRLDLEHAIDPGAHLAPYMGSFGELTAGDSKTLTIEVASASAEEEQWQLSVEVITGTSAAVDMRSVVVPAGETKTFDLTFDSAEATQQEHWGDVLLSREGTDQVLRLAYFAFVDHPQSHTDVMLVNWTWGDTRDHSHFYIDALEQAGLSFVVWDIDDEPASDTNMRMHPPLKTMRNADLVIINTNESDWALQTPLVGQYQYLNYLLQGGSMLITGQGAMNWWRHLSQGNYPDSAYYREYCGPWWPRCWEGPSQNGGCDMCLPRYFSGFTHEYTATLSGKFLIPPEQPDWSEREVLLPPHEEADGPFAYALDLSTGMLAKDGAAGNQYTFASGDTLTSYTPSGDTAAEGRDYDSTEGVFERVRPYAKPLWAYTGEFENEDGDMEEMTKVVGTYIAGKIEPEAEIAWSSMFWGFGLEGVGKDGDDTVARDRLLGDAFNFLARNLRADHVTPSFDRGQGLLLEFPDVADVPVVEKAEIDWGDDGEVETVVFDPPVPADVVAIPHDYAEEGTYEVGVTLTAQARTAPMYDIGGEIEGGPMMSTIYMPVAVRGGVIGTPESFMDRIEPLLSLRGR